jgi:hypothetical protein
MGYVSNAMITAYEAGVVPVFAPDRCPDLETDGEHGLVYLSVDGHAGPVRLACLLVEDAEDYIESCGCDNEVGRALDEIHADRLFCKHFAADGEDSPNDYVCGHCGHGWTAYNATNNASGRQAPCPECREMNRPTIASLVDYQRRVYG